MEYTKDGVRYIPGLACTGHGDPYLNPTFEFMIDNENTPLIKSREASANGLKEDQNGNKSRMSSTSNSECEETGEIHHHKSKKKRIFKNVKIGVIFLLLFVVSIILAACPTHELQKTFHSVIKGNETSISLKGCTDDVIKITVEGPFDDVVASEDTENLSFLISGNIDNKTLVAILPLNEYYSTDITKKIKVDMSKSSLQIMKLDGDYDLTVKTTSEIPISFSFSYVCEKVSLDTQVVAAAVILVAVYILIIFELIHRTLAAMIGSFAAVATLAAINERPSLELMMTWVEYETLTLLFGMMILVAIFCESGFFDWAAFQAYKKARGNAWVLITMLCLFGAFISAFLDNVTTMLLLTPITIRLCEVLNLDPRKVLIAEVVFSNIGGAATAVGDPPNVIIVSYGDAIVRGVNFTNFTVHMMIGVFFIVAVSYGVLRIMYRNMNDLQNDDPPEVNELKHEIDVWRRASKRINVQTREESMVRALLLQKVATLENLLHNYKMYTRTEELKTFDEGLIEMAPKYRIRDYPLLIKSGIILSTVILFFFISSFADNIDLTLAWVAIIGAMWLMVLSDFSDIESLLHKVEWATLIFFAGLFIMMRALEELGLIQFIANLLTGWIESVEDSQRLTVSIILILWVSALASSFIDNIPFTTAMMPVLSKLADNKDLNLPYLPLVWTLAFGTCLGGNGTLIGASANVVCAGLAEQHNYGFTFVDFFKVGFPMMLVSVTVAMFYLLLVHVGFGWNFW